MQVCLGYIHSCASDVTQPYIQPDKLFLLYDDIVNPKYIAGIVYIVIV